MSNIYINLKHTNRNAAHNFLLTSLGRNTLLLVNNFGFYKTYFYTVNFSKNNFLCYMIVCLVIICAVLKKKKEKKIKTFVRHDFSRSR